MPSSVVCRCLFRLMRRYFLGRWICLLVSERLRLVWQCCPFGCNTYIQFCVHWHGGQCQLRLTPETLVLFEVISSGCNALVVPFQQLLEGPCSPLVWACQWPLSQPLSTRQLSHNDNLWALGITRNHRDQSLDYGEGDELSWCPSWSNSLWQGWRCELVHWPGGNASDLIEECWPLPMEYLPELP